MTKFKKIVTAAAATLTVCATSITAFADLVNFNFRVNAYGHSVTTSQSTKPTNNNTACVVIGDICNLNSNTAAIFNVVTPSGNSATETKFRTNSDSFVLNYYSDVPHSAGTKFKLKCTSGQHDVRVNGQWLP